MQYALAIAGQGDSPAERELGPIQLVKLVYFADLAHAEHHSGATFTDVDWRFHHYGPWCVDVWRRIPDAMTAIGATERVFDSRYREDNHRWRIDDQAQVDAVLQDLERQLPPEVALAVARAVREFRQDTSALLHAVYQTPPMLKAAPDEVLEFSMGASISPDAPGEVAPEPAQGRNHIQEKLPRKTRERLNALRERVRLKLTQPPNVMLVPPSPPPCFDAEYEEASTLLDRLAGEPIERGSGLITFSEQIWKSMGRSEPDEQ